MLDLGLSVMGKLGQESDAKGSGGWSWCGDDVYLDVLTEVLLWGAMKQGRGTSSMFQSFLVILPNVPAHTTFIESGMFSLFWYDQSVPVWSVCFGMFSMCTYLGMFSLFWC